MADPRGNGCPHRALGALSQRGYRPVIRGVAALRDPGDCVGRDSGQELCGTRGPRGQASTVRNFEHRDVSVHDFVDAVAHLHRHGMDDVYGARDEVFADQVM